MQQILMEEKTERAETRAGKGKVLIAAVVILAIAFLGLAVYSFQLKKELDRAAVRTQLLESQLRLGAAVPAEEPPFDSFASPGSWDPFAEMERMRLSMNRMFQESFRRASLFDSGTGAFPPELFEPELDIRDTADGYVITLDLPGMEKDRISVDVAGRALTISGERRSDQEDRNVDKGFYRMERRFGAFQRTIPLPEDANPASLKASYDKGVLRIELQKLPNGTQNQEPKKIPVQ